MSWQLCDFKIRLWLEWGVSLSRAGVMSCDEEQVCLMIKQVQVKAISDGGYGPFSNSLSVVLYIDLCVASSIIVVIVLVLRIILLFYLEYKLQGFSFKNKTKTNLDLTILLYHSTVLYKFIWIWINLNSNFTFKFRVKFCILIQIWQLIWIVKVILS